jgi:hypothetical protein
MSQVQELQPDAQAKAVGVLVDAYLLGAGIWITQDTQAMFLGNSALFQRGAGVFLMFGVGCGLVATGL